MKQVKKTEETETIIVLMYEDIQDIMKIYNSFTAILMPGGKLHDSGKVLTEVFINLKDLDEPCPHYQVAGKDIEFKESCVFIKTTVTKLFFVPPELFSLNVDKLMDIPDEELELEKEY